MIVAVDGDLLVTMSVPVSPLTWLDATEDAQARNAIGRTLRKRRLGMEMFSVESFK
jgi:hypothetical protein